MGRVHLFRYGLPSSPLQKPSISRPHCPSFPEDTRLPSLSSCPLYPSLFAITGSSPTGPVLIPQRRSGYPCYTTECGKKKKKKKQERSFLPSGGLDITSGIWIIGGVCGKEGEPWGHGAPAVGSWTPPSFCPPWFNSKSSGGLT